MCEDHKTFMPELIVIFRSVIPVVYLRIK